MAEWRDWPDSDLRLAIKRDEGLARSLLSVILIYGWPFPLSRMAVSIQVRVLRSALFSRGQSRERVAGSFWEHFPVASVHSGLLRREEVRDCLAVRLRFNF
jgi:hypothetical protein